MNNFRVSKIGLAVFVFLLAANLGFSQNYSITPDDTIIGTVPFNDIYHFTIEQNNETSDTLYFSWQKIIVEHPPEWEAFLCDNATCFADFPDSGTMSPTYPDEYGFLSVGINPGSSEGEAFVRYEVWEASTPEQIDTLTWIINAVTNTEIDNLQKNTLCVFPNPASNEIFLQTNIEEGFYWELTDLTGKKILRGFSKKRNSNIAVNTINEGVYFISVAKESGILSTQKIIIQQ